MLTYIVKITEDLFITFALIGMIYAYASDAWGSKGKIVIWSGAGVGLIASVMMAILKNTTNLIYTNRWNLGIFLVTILATILFIIFSAVFVKKENTELEGGGWAAALSAAFLVALLLFYEVPDVCLYPFLFDTIGEGILTVSFLLKLLGWLGGLILIYVFTVYLNKCAVALNNRRLVYGLLVFGILVNAVRCFGQALRPWITRAKWVSFLPQYSKDSYPWAFPFASFVANNTMLFTALIAGAAAIIPVVLFIHNRKVTGMYENCAQLRKLKSICRKNRRRASAVVICFILCIFNLTFVSAYTNKTVELSTPEEYNIDGENIIIDLTQVDDGHLHRFEYETESGTAVRWIIVKKPGSSAYGVGLDACDVCGTAGYYERDDQIVCKRCDVVMNINTIGFKGGCNPIPLTYEVTDGQIIIPLQAILDSEKNF